MNDDQNQVQNQPSQQQPIQTQVSQQPQPPVPVPQPPQQNAVGSVAKEAGPIAPVQEHLQASGAEVQPVLHPEVQKAGVEVSKNVEVPRLDLYDQKAGLQHSGATAPIPTQSNGIVQLYNNLKSQGADKGSITNSNSWLYKLVAKVGLQLGFIRK